MATLQDLYQGKVDSYNPENDRCIEVLRAEGGTWEPINEAIWFDASMMEHMSADCHAYKFKSGRIWDVVNGWRDQQSKAAAAAGRTFETGAYRDTDSNKLDYEAFLSPLVLERYAQYMHKNRLQSNGELRDGDNWQKGIPANVYMKSAWRHFMEWWTLHRYGKSYTSVEETSRLEAMEEALCALLFNVQGYLFELIKKRKEKDANRSESPSLGA